MLNRVTKQNYVKLEEVKLSEKPEPVCRFLSACKVLNVKKIITRA